MSTVGRNAPCPYGITEFIAVLIPTRDGQLSYETHEALKFNLGNIPTVTIVERHKPVIEARNSLAEQCLQLSLNVRYALWCDSDAWWPRGTIERMLQIMEQRPDIDCLSGYSCDRMPFCTGGGFRMLNGRPFPIVPNTSPAAFPVPSQMRFNPYDVVEVDRVPFHFVLMRKVLLERIGAEPFNVPRNARYGEDFCFCERVQSIGAKIATDTAAMVAHVDVSNGLAFIPQTRPGQIIGGGFYVVADSRSDQQIVEDWAEVNIRAGRRYGGRVDMLMSEQYREHIRNRRRQQFR